MLEWRRFTFGGATCLGASATCLINAGDLGSGGTPVGQVCRWEGVPSSAGDATGTNLRSPDDTAVSQVFGRTARQRLRVPVFFRLFFFTWYYL